MPETAFDHPIPLRESFDAFYVREFPKMVALAVAVSGSRAAAEDLAQEALMRAHRNWDRIANYDKPGAWVRRVTINLCTSLLRRNAAEGKAKLRLVGGGVELPPEPPEDSAIWRCVAELPKRQRAAVALHYLEDRSVAEIADILNCSESTAKVHLHRGRRALASALESNRSHA